MSHFPKPIPIPNTVFKERNERVQQLLASCFWGILLRIVIITAEILGVYFFGSSALLMDALTSLVDVFSSILLIICIKFAARPPDANHPFGHGRFEPLVGLQLGLIMSLIGGGDDHQADDGTFSLKLPSYYRFQIMDNSIYGNYFT